MSVIETTNQAQDGEAADQSQVPSHAMSRHRSRFRQTWALWVVLCLLVGWLGGHFLQAWWHEPTWQVHASMPQRVYVWQMQWTDAVADSVQHAMGQGASHPPKASGGGVCFLAATVTPSREVSESDETGTPPEVRWANWDDAVLAGQATAEPSNKRQATTGALPGAVGVVRVGVPGGGFVVGDGVYETVRDVCQRVWEQTQAAGWTLDALQLDVDCPTRQLAAYRVWLEALAKDLPWLLSIDGAEASGADVGTSIGLGITCLPTWMNDGAFVKLVQGLDHFVLQVHFFETPKRLDNGLTLCDPVQAMAWVKQAGHLAERAGTVFDVALPTYGYQLIYRNDKTDAELLGLVAEGPARPVPAGEHAIELTSNTQELAALVRTWQAKRPQAMRGIVWFRLPVEGDRRNWSWPTLEAVAAGRVPMATWSVQAAPGTPGSIPPGSIPPGNIAHGSVADGGPSPSPSPSPGPGSDEHLWTLRLTNTGDDTGVLSETVWECTLPSSPWPPIADGQNGWQVQQQRMPDGRWQCTWTNPSSEAANGNAVNASAVRRLRPGQAVVVGWLRSENKPTFEMTQVHKEVPHG